VGLVLAQHANPDAPSWLTYDQSSVLPAALREKSTAFFALRGPCKQYAGRGMVHQYAPVFSWNIFPPGPTVRGFRDFWDDSCLNGWTCGNMAARPLDLASFFWHLLHRGPENTAPILSPASLAAMLDFKPLTVGFAPGLEYGLGLMADPGGMVGHAGEDWGSAAPVAGYDQKNNFAMAVVVNSPFGMTCRDGDFVPNFWMGDCIGCRLKVATYVAIGVASHDLIDKICERPCNRSSNVEVEARRLFNLETGIPKVRCKF
jgi:hypothetical protein